MTENIIEVLIYIFESHMKTDSEELMDEILLKEKLTNIGFKSQEINNAFDWLDELTWQQNKKLASLTETHYRIFSETEKRYLTIEAQNTLLILKQKNILTTKTFELVLDRIMALKKVQLNIKETKWLVLFILINQPNQDAAFATMRDLVYNDTPKQYH